MVVSRLKRHTHTHEDIYFEFPYHSKWKQQLKRDKARIYMIMRLLFIFKKKKPNLNSEGENVQVNENIIIFNN